MVMFTRPSYMVLHATSTCSNAPHVMCCIPLQDSRSSSPARSPKGLQTDQVSHGAVHATVNNGSTGVPTRHSQQSLPSAVAQGTTSNASGVPRETTAAACVDQGCVNATSSTPELEAHQYVGCIDPEAPIQGDAACRAPPTVPPLAPGTVLRTSSAGSSTMVNRKASLLSSAFRASSRTSTPAQQQQQVAEITFQQLECQQPSRSAVTQLPIHLVAGYKDHDTPPPSVATEQVCSSSFSSTSSCGEQPPFCVACSLRRCAPQTFQQRMLVAGHVNV